VRGVKLVISDAHEGLKAAAGKVLGAGWQRCRVHFMRNALAHASKNGRRVVSAFVATAFAQHTPAAASKQWRHVADQLRSSLPKLAALLDEAEIDVLAFMDFPKEHWTKICSTNPIERLNGEIKRRTDVIGIFPNDDAIIRLVGANTAGSPWPLAIASTSRSISRLSSPSLVSRCALFAFALADRRFRSSR
jgi:putative transposase